jgi:ABC-2 type transport system ATP-binding protein
MAVTEEVRGSVATAPPRAEAPPAIEARGLVKSYGDVRALEGVGFGVAPGSIFALLGTNGAGKSTTVKILTTLSKPDEGDARVAGFDVLREPGKVRRHIGVVAQGSASYKDATGRETVRLQGQIYGMRGRALKARVDELLTMYGLGDSADRLVREYSGGMRRRLDIAAALVHSPEVLFLDEPTTGLDPEVRAAMWDHVERLARDEGVAVLLTTHYLEEADRLAERVAIIDRGRIVAQGTPDELKAELRGDAIQVELDGGGSAAPQALQALPQVRDVVVDGKALRARTDDGARTVPAVLSALEAAGVTVTSVTVARPSLDDVYLRLTGRTFSEAEAEQEREESEQGGGSK